MTLKPLAAPRDAGYPSRRGRRLGGVRALVRRCASTALASAALLAGGCGGSSSTTVPLPGAPPPPDHVVRPPGDAPATGPDPSKPDPPWPGGPVWSVPTTPDKPDPPPFDPIPTRTAGVARPPSF